MARANIASSDILRRLREGIILLAEEVERSVSAANHDSARVLDWLQQQQLPETRRRFLRQEQQFSEARIAYLAAKQHSPAAGPQAHEEVERSYLRAKAQLEALQHRLHTIEAVLARLPRDMEQPMAAIRRSGSRMQDYALAAITRLDQMRDDLDRYQETSG
ncbi:MAG: hypothetical protein EA401_11135 [Planctomycetota bacterium]|nr:MAG: hypothetical protein EA401_11135 [Planctomycetota bacterium]